MKVFWNIHNVGGGVGSELRLLHRGQGGQVLQPEPELTSIGYMNTRQMYRAGRGFIAQQSQNQSFSVLYFLTDHIKVPSLKDIPREVII